ncbi:hypothetical protein [Geodermatophilus sp. SYSU D01036]
MTVPGAPRPEETGGGDPAGRGRFGLSNVFRRSPGHIGRARTSTLVLAALFVGLGVLYLYVKPPDPATVPAGGTTEVTTPAPAPETTAPPTTTEPGPTTTGPEPEPTTEPEETAPPSAPTTTAPATPTLPTTTAPRTTEPGTETPTTQQPPSPAEEPPPTTDSTPTT